MDTQPGESPRPNGKDAPPPALPRRAATLLYLAFGLLGVLAAFWPTWASGFARMQSERSDSLHIHYVLEHQFRQLVGSGVGTYWSPGYFHPVTGGLAYSENLLATLPVYSATRLLFAPATSFQIWGMAMLVANFVAMIWALRSLGARPWVAAGGAFVFAFALTRVAHLNHQHMLPHFAAPVAIWAALRWFERPALRAWAALWIALGVQLLAGLHLGWFLALALAIWALLRFGLEPAAWRRQGAWLRSDWLRATATALAVVAVVGALLAPYAAARSAHGARDDGQVTIFAPRWTSWLAAPAGTLASAVGLQSDPTTPFYWEHELFPGFALLAAAAIALVGVRRPAAYSTSIRALILAGLALVALSLYVPLRSPGPDLALRDLGFTLWWGVWDWVPGASSMRAVGRVWSGVLPLLVVGGFLGIEALVSRLRARPLRCLALLLVPLAAAEQLRFGQPNFDKALHERRVERWRAQIPADCPAVYFAIPAAEPPRYNQITAMWAALDAGVPTVNAYTSNYPPGYPSPDRAATPEELEGWLRQSGAGAVCRVTPEGS